MELTIRIVEIAVLVLAAWPLARLVAMRSLKRVFPRAHAAAAGALALWLAGVALLAWRLPVLLHPLAAVAVAAAAMAAWRGRPGYGRRRGLPPGSLSLTDSVEAIANREFYRERAARHGPVFKMAQFHRPVACVVGLERGHRLLREHQESLGPSPQPFSREIPGGFLRYMDEETYGVYGPLFRRALSAGVVDHARPVAVETARVELERAAAEARRRGAPVDLDPHLERLVRAAFLRALFGIDPAEPDFDRLNAAFEPLARMPLSEPLDRRARAAMVDLRRLLEERHARWRDAPDAAPVCAMAELARLDPRMPDDTCLDNLLFIHKIASSNMVGLLRWLVVIPGRDPRWIARLRSELESGEPGGEPALVDRVVMETLRLSQSEYLYRRLDREVSFEGFRLPAGWLVRVCVWESHRDEERFEEPERFDPDRFLEGHPPRSAYSPFGAHHHACNGVPLVNLVARVFLEAIVRDYDWRVEDPEDLGRDFRHWSHWRPRSRTLLEPVTPRSAPARSAPASATGPAR